MRTALSENGAAESRNGIGAPSGDGTWLERWSVWSNVCSELAALLAVGGGAASENSAGATSERRDGRGGRGRGGEGSAQGEHPERILAVRCANLGTGRGKDQDGMWSALGTGSNNLLYLECFDKTSHEMGPKPID